MNKVAHSQLKGIFYRLPKHNGPCYYITVCQERTETRLRRVSALGVPAPRQRRHARGTMAQALMQQCRRGCGRRLPGPILSTAAPTEFSRNHGRRCLCFLNAAGNAHPPPPFSASSARVTVPRLPRERRPLTQIFGPAKSQSGSPCVRKIPITTGRSRRPGTSDFFSEARHHTRRLRDV